MEKEKLRMAKMGKVDLVKVKCDEAHEVSKGGI